MPTERVQRRIDRLLDEAELAADGQEWPEVERLTREVLALDPDNEDSPALLRAAQEMLGGSPMPAEPHRAEASSAPTTDEAPSSFANGRYEVKSLLGEGGKKKVYLAQDTTLDREVAFGLIKADGLDVEGRQRITREAQAMARLGDHPNLMPIFDLGEESGQPYMVQPLMVGGDVEALIEEAEEGRLPLEDALRISSEICRGLEFAHGKGIIHRDLKPGNVWLTNDGTVRIGDFGLALSLERSRLTTERMMVGTVAYMPPEQATGGEVTARADLYSLGAMLYEMVTGRPPFMGDDDIAIIGQHINTPPVAPGWHNSSLPQTLDSLIMRLLSKDPSGRPENAAEVLQALSAIDPAETVAARDEQQGSLDAMSGGVFVGRHREMDTLKSVFEETLGGHGKMMALVGEPGIGKSRTAQELATYASMRGGQVLWGRCYEGGGAPPYWPWVQAIRSYVTEKDAATVREAMGSTASVISEIVPDVKERLPDVEPPQPLGDAESARFRLFDGIATFLKAASASQPMVLMLEDLHWSDRPSLMLLEFVARELGNSRLMIVGNYRDVDLNRRHPLSITLGELTRERLYDRVLLRGLQKHDVHRFIEVAAGIDPPDSLVDVVHTQTEGNPLFVTETVRLLIQQGDIASGGQVASGTSSWEIQIPEGVREVIGRRLDRLSERTNETLTIAAVIGRQFSFDALRALVEDTSESQLLDVLDEALDARVIEEIPTAAGDYQFTHALIEQTLVEELSLTRRVRLHARIALALETLYGDETKDHAAQLAHHFAEAVTVAGEEKMVRYSQLAGDAASAAYAHEEARTHFERALAAKVREKIDAEMGALLFGLGRAQIALLDMDGALANFGQAFDYYEDADDVERAVEIAAYPLPTAFALFPGATDLAERALKLVSPDSHEAGRILSNYIGLVGLQKGDYNATSRALEQAISIARRENDQALEFKSLAAASITALYHHNYVDRGNEVLRICDRAIDLSGSVDDLGSEAMARYCRSVMLAQLGEPDSAEEAALLALQAADKLRDRSLISRTNFAIATVAFFRGDWETAREYTDKGIFYAPRDLRSLFIRSLLEYETGNAKEGDQFLDRAIEATLSSPRGPSLEYSIAAGMVGFASLISGHESRHEFAEEAADLVLSAQTATPFVTMFAHIAFTSMAIARGDIPTIAKMYDHFLPLKRRHPFIVSGDRMLGMTALAMGDSGLAEGHFQDAISFSRDAGYRPQEGWSMHDYAALLIERNEPGDSEKATELQDGAITIATELGMEPLLERVLAQREVLKA